MDAHYEDDAVTLYHGDSLEVLRELPAGSVDAVVTDPPYGISFMGKQWDQPGEYGSKRKNGTPAVHAREAGRDRAAVGDTGAMDAGRYDLSPPAMRNFQRWVEAWSGECLRVLKPGGHLLAFGGSRTWHRLAGGIEDAGFELRDSIAWLYGSGFPKSRDVSAQMQGYLSGERPVDAGPPVEVYTVTAYLREARDRAGWTNRQIDELFGTNGMSGHWVSRGSQPAVPSVRQWAVLKDRLGMGDDVDELVERLASTERPEDWGQGSGESFLESLRKDGRFESAGGWGTALKPAFEPVVVARKPVESSTTRNVAVYGTGALNVDGCRVPMTAEDRAEAEAKNAHARFGTEAGQNARSMGTTRRRRSGTTTGAGAGGRRTCCSTTSPRRRSTGQRRSGPPDSSPRSGTGLRHRRRSGRRSAGCPIRRSSRSSSCGGSSGSSLPRAVSCSSRSRGRGRRRRRASSRGSGVWRSSGRRTICR